MNILLNLRKHGPPLRPYMSAAELKIVTTVLKRASPLRCLEWGAGGSTLYFSRYLPKRATWESIEHDERWARDVKERLTRQNVTVRWIPPNKTGPWGGGGEDGTLEEFADYVAAPQGAFDFVLVDGRARSACLARAHGCLTPRGIVVLHDAGRPYYHAALQPYQFQVLLKDAGDPEHGLWIGSNEVDVKEVYRDVIDWWAETMKKVAVQRESHG